MPRDKVHRVVGEETVHRGAFGGGLVGGALAVLRGGGDQRGLDHRGEDRHGIDLPGRHRQARDGQRARRLDARPRPSSATAAASAARSTAGRPPASAASAGTSANHTINGEITPPVSAAR